MEFTTDPGLGLARRQQMVEFFESVFRHSNATIEPLAGDASARRYFRVVAGAESFVLMVWEPFKDDDSYPFLSVLRHFAKCNVHVPRVHGVDEAAGLILLEDLGDLTLERKFWENQNPLACLSFYELAIEELVKIHVQATRQKSSCTAFHVAFDEPKLMWELNYGREHLLHGLSELKLSEAETQSLDRIFHDVCSRLAQEPRVICHRDYHSRNIMLKMGEARVIDFQDARMGPIQYDLVSLFRDSYVSVPSNMSDQLAQIYLTRLADLRALPEGFSQEKFKEIYELQTVQRCFKACGSFASFFRLRGDTRYLKYLPQTLQTVRAALREFPKYAEFEKILDDYGLFDADFAKLAEEKRVQS